MPLTVIDPTGIANTGSFTFGNVTSNIVTANTFSGDGSQLSNVIDTVARSTANAAFQTANSGTGAASAGSYANSAFESANSAGLYANSAFLAANTADAKAVSAGSYANSAYGQANTATSDATAADSKAVTAGSYANSAYTQANTATTNAATADSKAVSAGSYANSAYTQANTATSDAATADSKAVTAGSYANSAYSQANTATTNAATADGKAVTSGEYANAALVQANAAYTRANNSLNANTGGTITGSLTISGGDLSVTGNLIITGNTITQNVQSLEITDPLIYLAANNYVSDVVEIGFTANYFDGSNNRHTGIFREASNKQYYVFDNYEPEPNANLIDISDPSFRIATLNANLVSESITLNNQNLGTFVNNAYAAANTSDSKALSAGSYANSAFAVANTDVTNVNITAATYGNNTTIPAITVAANGRVVAVNNVGVSIPSGSFISSGTSNVFFSGVNGDIVANVAGNTVFTLTANGFTTAGASGDISGANNITANTFVAANSIIVASLNVVPHLQSAYTAANTADSKATSAGSYANSAFAVANTDVTGVSATPGTYGGTTAIPVITLAANGRVTSVTNASITATGSFINSGTSNVFFSGVNGDIVANVAGNTIFSITANGIVTAGASGDISGANAIYANTIISANGIVAAGINVVPHLQSAFVQANTPSHVANSAALYANGAFVQANASYTQANTATTNAATADSKAVTAGSYANSAYTQANTATTNAATADGKAVTAGSYANSAFGVANSAASYANAAFLQANAAFAAANSATSNVYTFTGTGSCTAFTLSTTTNPSSNSLIVNIDGVLQLHSAYNVSSNVVTFTSAPANTAEIEIQIITGASGSQGSLTLTPEVPTTSGNTVVVATNIPSWAKCVTVGFYGISLSGTASPLIQFGTGATPTWTTSGYISSSDNYATTAGPAAGSSDGFRIGSTASGATVYHGSYIFSLVGSNKWVGQMNGSVGVSTVLFGGGAVELSAALTSIRLTSTNGTDTYDAGSVSVLYE